MKLRSTYLRAYAISIITLVAGCIYTGPKLSDVVTSTCDAYEDYNGFFSCVERTWYSSVVAAGRQNDGRVKSIMAAGKSLRRGVEAGQVSDSAAIYQFQRAALKLADEDRAARSADLASIQQSFDRVGSYEDRSDAIRIRQPVHCNTYSTGPILQTRCY